MQDGPFTEDQYTVTMGPGVYTEGNPRCLRRDFAPSFAVSKCNGSEAAWPQSAETFAEFDIRAQGGITTETMTYHPGGHFGVGGELGDVRLYKLHVPPTDAGLLTITPSFSSRISTPPRPTRSFTYITQTWTVSGRNGKPKVRLLALNWSQGRLANGPFSSHKIQRSGQRTSVGPSYNLPIPSTSSTPHQRIATRLRSKQRCTLLAFYRAMSRS